MAAPRPRVELSALSCWVVSVEYAGMENQCVGLAEAIGLRWIVKHVYPTAPWKYLPPRFWWRPLETSSPADRFQPPWPDVLIASGWRSVAAAMAVRRASGGKTFTIYIQNPHVHPRRFDIVIAPQHDALRGDNVLLTAGALHRVVPARLAEAGRRLAPALAHLPRPLVAVLVGGSNQRQEVSPAVIGDLADKLAALSRGYGAGIVVTPSRRTGAANERILQERLHDLPAVVWDGQGENPYFGYLGLADAIVVTADSVSMVSEACATGKPVYIYELEGGGRRLRRFHESLRAAGITRPFAGVLEHWSYPPLDDTARVAATIRERLALRLS